MTITSHLYFKTTDMQLHEQVAVSFSVAVELTDRKIAK